MHSKKSIVLVNNNNTDYWCAGIRVSKTKQKPNKQKHGKKHAFVSLLTWATKQSLTNALATTQITLETT